MFCIYRCFSGKVHGRLVQSTCLVHHVQYIIEVIKIFAADQGVLSKAMFKIVTPEVDKYLLREAVKRTLITMAQLISNALSEPFKK